MPSPSASLATLRPDLGGSFEEFGLEADRLGFIGTQVLPVFETKKQSGPFGVIPIEQLLKGGDTKRAPGAGYSKGDWKFETQTFACEEHGWVEPVDDREAAMYSDFFSAEQVSAQRARDIVLRNAETRIADAVFNTTTFTPQTVTNEWDDAANATPVGDVETAVQAVYAASGIWPNALIVNRKVFRNLRLVDEIQALSQSQNFMDVRAGSITAQMMAIIFDLQMVLVAGSTKNTANEGQAASLSPIWSDEYAMVCKVAVSNDIRETSLGRTFHWAEDGSIIGGTVESYRDEDRRSDMIRTRHDVDEKLIYTVAAKLLDNITT